MATEYSTFVCNACGKTFPARVQHECTAALTEDRVRDMILEDIQPIEARLADHGWVRSIADEQIAKAKGAPGWQKIYDRDIRDAALEEAANLIQECVSEGKSPNIYAACLRAMKSAQPAPNPHDSIDAMQSTPQAAPPRSEQEGVPDLGLPNIWTRRIATLERERDALRKTSDEWKSAYEGTYRAAAMDVRVLKEERNTLRSQLAASERALRALHDAVDRFAIATDDVDVRGAMAFARKSLGGSKEQKA